MLLLFLQGLVQIAFIWCLLSLRMKNTEIRFSPLDNDPFCIIVILSIGFILGVAADTIYQESYNTPVPIRYQLVKTVMPVAGNNWR